MRKILTTILSATVIVGCAPSETETVQKELTKYVDPFIGTGFHGHTFPGATRPNAMVQLSPDTHLSGWAACSGYHADDSLIYAFSHTHLSGTGIGDLGDIALLPYTGNIQKKPIATFKKESEQASPGYYKVHLDNYNVAVELTSTERVGLHKYSYPKGSDRRVMLDLGHVLQADWGHKVTGNTYTLVNDSTIEGTHRTQGWAYNHSVSYRITFSEKFEKIYQYVDGNLRSDSLFVRLITDKDVKMHYLFPQSDKPLYAKVALSMVDPSGAERNMVAEMPEWNFEQVRQQSAEIWNNALAAIDITTTDPSILTNFYTSLYHSLLAPYNYQDTDGRYLGMDKKVHRAEPDFTYYTVFSMWDTFRALHPLITIIDPAMASHWGNVLVKNYEEGGVLPKWPLASNYTGTMVGYPATSVLADLVTKGLAKGDMNKWTEACVNSASYNHDLVKKFEGTREARVISRMTYFKEKLGYIPADSLSESVSWGQELAYYDWCVAQVAKAANDNKTVEEFEKKAKYYLRYLDPETKFMRGVMADGTFRTPFNPRYSSHMKSDYTEGNAFQWSFFAPHDMDNFIEKIGGRKELETRLDTLFTTSSRVDGENASGDITGLIGQYAHGNEPSHHMAYLYNWTDSPWKGQERLDYIMREFYLPQDDGIIGNEDCGQMSAWYVMSAIGLYQVCPGNPQYSIGRPIIDAASIPVAGGTFDIIVHNNSPANKYVESVSLNGKTLTNLIITHDDIVKVVKLEFHMTNLSSKVFLSSISM